MPDRPDPTVFVLFGATGDLAKRMVLPAFYQLCAARPAARAWLLIGNGRGDVVARGLPRPRQRRADRVRPEPEGDEWEEFAATLRFAGGGFDEGQPRQPARRARGGHDATWRRRAVHPLPRHPADGLRQDHRGPGRARARRGRAGHLREAVRHVAGELPRARRAVHNVLDEQQVFRIDHFLGKEATQNLHALRFGNGLFDARLAPRPRRAPCRSTCPRRSTSPTGPAFYDETGAAARHGRHPPVPGRGRGGDGAAAVDVAPRTCRRAREAVISRLPPAASPTTSCSASSTATATPRASPTTRTTDTFVAARLWIDTDRWRGVPFLLRTGKQLAASAQQVSLIFRARRRPARTTAARARQRAVRRRWPARGSVRPARRRQGAGRRLRPDCADTELPLGDVRRRRPAAAVRQADPRRHRRRPVAVHPPRRPGRRLGPRWTRCSRRARSRTRTHRGRGDRRRHRLSRSRMAGCWANRAQFSANVFPGCQQFLLRPECATQDC